MYNETIFLNLQKNELFVLWKACEKYNPRSDLKLKFKNAFDECQSIYDKKTVEIDVYEACALRMYFHCIMIDDKRSFCDSAIYKNGQVLCYVLECPNMYSNGYCKYKVVEYVKNVIETYFKNDNVDNDEIVSIFKKLMNKKYGRGKTAVYRYIDEDSFHNTDNMKEE